MDDEDVIRHEYVHGPLTHLGAIRRLEGLGYSEADAEDLLADWAVAAMLPATVAGEDQP